MAVSIPEGYKQTEVGVIPEDWEVKPLSCIGEIIRGASPRPKGDKRFYGGNFPRLMVEDVTRDGKVVIPKIDFLTPEGVKKSRPCKAGTLTIVCSGTVGVVSFLGVDACIHDGFLALVNINNQYQDDFLYHQLSTLREKFDSSATHGGVFTNLTTSGVKEFLVPLPATKTEQTAIANALSDADAWIQSLTRLIAKKRQIKQGAMQRLLNPYEDGVLKEGWVVKKLGDFCSVYSGGTPSTSMTSYYDGDLAWITSGDLNKKFIRSVNSFITKEGFDNSSAKMVSENTLLIALYGATAGVVALSKIHAAINQAVLAIIPNSDVSNIFLFYYLMYKKDYFINTYTQGGQPNFSGNIVKFFDIAMPDDNKQTRIATLLSDMDSEITQLDTKLTKAKTLKQGMMQNLLTGKIRLVEPERTPTPCPP